MRSDGTSQLWMTGAGNVIRRLRRSRPIGKVAKQMGISVSMLSMLERNKRRLSLDEIVKFAAVIDVPPKNLFAMCLAEMAPGLNSETKPLVAYMITQLRVNNA